MKKKILIHDAANYTSKNINKALIGSLHKSHNIIFHSVHGSLFDIYQKEKPEYILLSASEYTQEFQDFLTDHSNDTNIFLFIDMKFDNQQLMEFWNSRPIKIVANKLYESQYSNCIASYGNMYSEEIFNNKRLKRNSKIAVMLSSDNSKNDIVKEIIYPNNIEHKIIAFNNPDFKSYVNLGILNGPDLSIVLNTFDSIIDIDQQLYLEAQACDIKYYDLDNNNISLKDVISEKRFKKLDNNLEEHTYTKFVNKHILQHIRT